MKTITIFSLCFLSLQAFAHSGGTDSAGCHHDRKNGGYHCHRGQDKVRMPSSIPTKDQMIPEVSPKEIKTKD